MSYLHFIVCPNRVAPTVWLFHRVSTAFIFISYKINFVDIVRFNFLSIKIYAWYGCFVFLFIHLILD